MTIDEELTQLEEAFRRLKVEYDTFFGGGSKKPPADTEWRVQALLKKHGESGRLTLAQRFRYNTVAQRYAIFSDLWRRKLRIKEEGYRRPQDALLGVSGLRTQEDRGESESHAETFIVHDNSMKEVLPLYESMMRARDEAGLPVSGFDAFATFVQTKTTQLRDQFSCAAVEYTVEVKAGRVRLKARPA